ncbi:aspartate-semialdehyde dehydrogenase [Liquorilactobacillus hordei]|uniref:Aspartate-semialdehyde dehydrogenase n=1 Tax=Liquorilactobacillus hordei DSM 19519 TaxID=1423759 RepID=A0A0R1MJJ8_9LACO|nr:aspartate-semialdehyde dehydrogenase [Liquorilactobacillus hordei]KRL07657.1 aspartate-semialdehyde dehydrogenase [Liquorilactobacillus hordei DSM 19519]QYH52620.1 aspartate-semialdehyde dehydrogenase [Liquorilactobacillus hordei DSM 19519]
MDGYNVAIVGATGAVGTRMIQMLEESVLPIASVKYLASKRSAGKVLKFKNEDVVVEELVPDSFNDVNLALFSAGGGVSKKFAPEAIKRGAVVVDNTSAFRMEEGVPLVVPEVNEKALYEHKGLIANPNCSTIQMVVALEPLRKVYGLKKVIVTTMQAVSGAGNRAIQELHDETKAILNGEEYKPQILPVSGDKKHYQIAFNPLAQIDVFEDDGYSHEEWKMIHETKKIMSDQDLQVTATCVRVPVAVAHSETVWFELEKSGADVAKLQSILKEAPGVVLEDDPKNQIYPQAVNAEGKKDTFVGRIRADNEQANSFHLYCVSDNLLKGAAWNSVQIAERLHALNLMRVPD